MDEQARREIEKINRRFGEGIRHGDAAAVGALYTDDALLMPPNSEMVHGKEGTTKFWAGAIKMGVKDAVLHTVEAHLTRIYRSLGVRSRTELARVMAARMSDGSEAVGSPPNEGRG